MTDEDLKKINQDLALSSQAIESLDAKAQRAFMAAAAKRAAVAADLARKISVVQDGAENAINGVKASVEKVEKVASAAAADADALKSDLENYKPATDTRLSALEGAVNSASQATGGTLTITSEFEGMNVIDIAKKLTGKGKIADSFMIALSGTQKGEPVNVLVSGNPITITSSKNLIFRQEKDEVVSYDFLDDYQELAINGIREEVKAAGYQNATQVTEQVASFVAPVAADQDTLKTIFANLLASSARAAVRLEQSGDYEV